MMKTALGLPMTSKKREGRFASRPAVYICVIVAATFGAFGYKLRTDGIFACQANGYDSDRYIAYCNAKGYADYEHGAFGFDLEPSAEQSAKKADVLFLGNSRLQVAFSTAATADWFSAASARYYLLGFSYHENVIFAEELLRKIQPVPRVYVINVDEFFDRTETSPVKTILHDPEARHRYEKKRFWQRVHEPICKRLPALCGNDYVIFRSRENGAYTKRTAEQKITPVSYDQVISQNAVSSDTISAREFLSRLSVEQKCVILTMVPTVGTKTGDANSLAKALNVNLIAPGGLTGLLTFDGSHLDRQSAERWSKAFFQTADSTIRSCLGDQGGSH